MTGPASAFAALGLEPGADQVAVDAAYRRLIKAHHPDRPGGDAGRAAEINQAYTALRQHQARLPDVIAPPRPARRRRAAQRHRRRRGLRWWPVAVLALTLTAIAQQERLAALAAYLTEAPRTAVAGKTPVGRVESDPSKAAMLVGIDEARFAAASDDPGVARERSRLCHREMRVRPSTDQLDRCAAFDYAVAALRDREPLSDPGPFGASALTSRHMYAAALLSTDYVSIEGRLNRIRSAVDIALAPAPPRVTAAKESDPMLTPPEPLAAAD